MGAPLGGNHGYKRYGGLIGRAIRLLTNGEQLPVDLMVALMNAGVDLSALEGRYAS